MAKALLLDEFHLSVLAPRGLPEADYQAICRILATARFRAELRRALRAVWRAYPSLGPTRVRISR
jgi:hypothetical protein